MQKYLGLILGAALGLALMACTGDSDADGGVSEARVKELIAEAMTDRDNRIATLETKVADLKAQIAMLEADLQSIPKPVRFFANGGSGSGSMKMESTTGTSLAEVCTVMDKAPAGGHPANMNRINCQSPTGFYSSWPYTKNAEVLHPYPLDNAVAVFTTGDCTGTPYVGSDLTGSAFFSLYQTETAGLVSMYVPADAVVMESFEYDSVLSQAEDGTWSCREVTTYAEANVVQAIPNDPTVTGYESTYMGPSATQ